MPVVIATLIAIFFAQLTSPTGPGSVVFDPVQLPSLVSFPSIDQVAMEPSGFSSTPSPIANHSTVPHFDQQVPIGLNVAPGYSLAGYEVGGNGPASNLLPENGIEEPVGNGYPFSTLESSESLPIDSTQTPNDESSQSSRFFFSKRWDGRRLLNLRQSLARRTGSDFGIGYERVMFAPMVLDTAVSSPYAGVRIRSDRGLGSPDRLEYLWAKAGRGPKPETRVDLIDTIYRTELGNGQAAFISELSMRALNPEVNGNTVGFGDMVVGGKGTIYDGRCTKISTIFLSYLNTGPKQRGLGTGHVSLEPGLLLRHQWSDATFLHSEIKYRLPIAGASGFAGDVLITGWGISTVWRDSDRYALMPTFELQTHSFLFGGQTLPSGVVRRVDGATAIDLFPGMRAAFAKSNIGTWEVGMSGGVSCADRDWFDSRLVLDLRWLR